MENTMEVTRELQELFENKRNYNFEDLSTEVSSLLMDNWKYVNIREIAKMTFDKRVLVYDGIMSNVLDVANGFADEAWPNHDSGVMMTKEEAVDYHTNNLLMIGEMTSTWQNMTETMAEYRAIGQLRTTLREIYLEEIAIIDKRNV